MSTFETVTRRRLLEAAGALAAGAAAPSWVGRADADETSGPGNLAVMQSDSSSDDPFLWLEEVDSERSRAWVTARNAETEAALCDDQFQRDRAAVLDILNAPDRLPLIVMRGGYAYNFWRDERNPKGLWRRTTLASYRTAAPDWEILLDIDALAKAEREDWVWSGATMLPPAYRFAIVEMSRGGADATVMREFDAVEKRFVDAGSAGGFSLPEAKGSATWLDGDTLLVASALGGEAFETASGYARTVRRWRRGTPFADAPVVFECERTDLSVSAWREHSPRYPRTGFSRQIDFFNSEVFVEDGGSLRKLDIPSDASVDVERNWLIVSLRSDWEAAGHRYKAGSLLVTGFDTLLAGKPDFTMLFEPTPTRFLESCSAAADVIAIQVLDNVQTHILFARRQGGPENGTWKIEPAAGLPAMETVSFQRLAADDIDLADDRRLAETFVVYSHSNIAPLTVWLARTGESVEMLKQAPARFDAAGLAITQHHAVSVDGTRIPYFQVARAGLALDGSHACLLTGYGGFESSELPSYSASNGKLWLERGGVYVIANIRGGGEFGPAWHKAGIREGKKLSHDDFAAIAKDLIGRGVTKPGRLACEGGSNGGLLVGNMLTRYPELFGAIDCSVPLLDMKRYTRLAAGASWIGEYGDPDKPGDWAFMRDFSAYQNADPQRAYPPVLLTTSARDDRVHPGHARKMAAKLIAQGHKVYFHEPQDGGHGGAVDNAHAAFDVALSFAFLRKTVADAKSKT
jgi:prolyl oligopeptidase